MIWHFFITIYRNIFRDKIFFFINLSNLTIGFTTFILLGMMVSYELSYDKYNDNYDRIYRVQTRQEDSSPTKYCTFSPAAFRYHLMAEQPEVEQLLLMREISGGQGGGQFITLPDGTQLYQRGGYFSENSIFDIFTIQLKDGTSHNALTEPSSIALSETLQKKLFPDGNAIGKKVVFGKRYSEKTKITPELFNRYMDEGLKLKEIASETGYNEAYIHKLKKKFQAEKVNQLWKPPQPQLQKLILIQS